MEVNKKTNELILCQNVNVNVKPWRCFYRKLYIFSNAGKTENVPEFDFDKFWKNIFWRWYKCNIYIVITSALGFKQLYMFYKFYTITPIQLSGRIPFGTDI